MKSTSISPGHNYSNYYKIAQSNLKKPDEHYAPEIREQNYYSQKKESNFSPHMYSRFQQCSTFSQSNASMRELENKGSFKYDAKTEPSHDFLKFIEDLNNLSRSKLEKNIETFYSLPPNILNKMQELCISGEFWNLILINKLKFSFCKNKRISLKISCSHRICKECFLKQIMDPSHSTIYNLENIKCIKCKNISINSNLALNSIISQKEINTECKKIENEMNLFKCNICNKSNISRLDTPFYSFECGDTFCLSCLKVF